MRILIYGLGRSGLAAARLCRRQGHQLSFFDVREQGADVDALLEMGAQRLGDVESAQADLCIAAPGVPIDDPDLLALRRSGIETIGEVEWVHRTLSSEMVGVTGTAGKGTVTRWLADALQLAGVDAVAGGNIDPALAEVAREGALHVVELSSFQLERCPTIKPRIAIVLNLGADHIDRHRDIATYHAAKKRLLANLGPEELFIYNADDRALAGWARETGARTAGFSLTAGAADSSFPDKSGPAPAQPGAYLEGDTLWLAGEPLMEAGQLRVQGRHHIANALAVALACRELGLGHEQIKAGLRAFQGLPGRYSEAGRVGSIRFIEDSIATRELSVRAALEASKAPLVWIAGGRSKGADVAELEDLVRAKVRLFIGVGEAGPAFHEVVSQWVPAHVCHEKNGAAALRCAVRMALQHLRAHSPMGGTVLLAPLAASFDQFRNYQERGETFRAVVREEAAEWTLSS